MKRIFAVLLIMSVLVCGCGKTGASHPENENTEEKRDVIAEEIASSETEMNHEEQKETEKESEVLNDAGEVEILAEYTLADSIGWYTRHFIVIKNNTSETVDVSTSSLAYAEDGSMVGAEDASL